MIDQLNVMSAAKKQADQTRIIRLEQVMQKTGMGRSFIYTEMSAGRIKPLKLGRALRFVESEIDQWVIDRIASR